MERLCVGLVALFAGLIALSVSAKFGLMLLLGDAVDHLGLARQIRDTNLPTLGAWGNAWLPLTHILIFPFVGKMELWHSGLAGAIPSLACYLLAVSGMFELSRRAMPAPWAYVATAFLGLNPNLLYLSTTAMTECLCLATQIWVVVVVIALLEAIENTRVRLVRNGLILLGALVLAGMMTRYEGWILGVVVWGIVTWQLVRRRGLLSEVAASYLAFTLLIAGGPILWFVYNHLYFQDWLSFLRGPYSAKGIAAKSARLANHYFGWHNPIRALFLFEWTAQLDAGVGESGALVAAAAIWGLWKGLGKPVTRIAALLWIPLPFYVYCISFGSLPTLIPRLGLHGYWRTRYGVEMLPAFALYFALALYQLARKFSASRSREVRFLPYVAILLIGFNYSLMLFAIPLVVKEAKTTSPPWVRVRDGLAAQLVRIPPGTPILMDKWGFPGAMAALQAASVPLKQTIGPRDEALWRSYAASPAESAGFAVARDGDRIFRTIQRKPDGFNEIARICSDGPQCIHVYQSKLYRVGVVPAGSD